MSPEIAILIAIASGVFALLGSLGSQIISATANIKAKRMELVYARRVESYKELIQKAHLLLENAENRECYADFHRAFLSTITVASEDVFTLLAKRKEGVLHIATRMNKAKNKDERDTLLKEYRASIDNLAHAMRRDLGRFAGK
jgi:hypothetical protein